MMSARPVKQKPQRKISYTPSKVAPQTPTAAPAPVAQTPEPTSVAQTPTHDPTPTSITTDETPEPTAISAVDPALVEPEVKQEVAETVKQEEPDAMKVDPSVDAPVKFEADDDEIPGLFGANHLVEPATPTPAPKAEEANDSIVVDEEDVVVKDSDESPHGVKRKVEEAELENNEAVEGESGEGKKGEEVNRAYKVFGDGSVEQEDTVKYVDVFLPSVVLYPTLVIVRLWEPGYKDRYYKQKFGAGPEDKEIRRR